MNHGTNRKEESFLFTPIASRACPHAICNSYRNVRIIDQLDRHASRREIPRGVECLCPPTAPLCWAGRNGTNGKGRASEFPRHRLVPAHKWDQEPDETINFGPTQKRRRRNLNEAAPNEIKIAGERGRGNSR